jgi:hypothetical protein
MTQTYRVIKAHQPEPRTATVLPQGERLAFERRPTQWEGWLWCTTKDGTALWVPEPWVRIENGDTCVLLREYDPAELSLEVGETITAELTASGWLLGTTPDGRRGWAPLECLQPE